MWETSYEQQGAHHRRMWATSRNSIIDIRRMFLPAQSLHNRLTSHSNPHIAVCCDSQNDPAANLSFCGNIVCWNFECLQEVHTYDIKFGVPPGTPRLVDQLVIIRVHPLDHGCLDTIYQKCKRSHHAQSKHCAKGSICVCCASRKCSNSALSCVLLCVSDYFRKYSV